MRQDDNGQVFVVRTGLDEESARELAAAMEARGHKQLYTAEPEPPDDDVST